MALYANYPIALAPGMGLNAYFAYVVVLQMGFTWQAALGAVFVSGCLFLLVTLFGLRELIISGIPQSIRSRSRWASACSSRSSRSRAPASWRRRRPPSSRSATCTRRRWCWRRSASSLIVVLDRLKVPRRDPDRHHRGDGAVLLLRRQHLPRRVLGAAVDRADLPAAGHQGRALGRHPERDPGVLPGRAVRRHRHADGRGQAAPACWCRARWTGSTRRCWPTAARSSPARCWAPRAPPPTSKARPACRPAAAPASRRSRWRCCSWPAW